MYKNIKKGLKILLWTVIILIVLLLGFALSLQLNPVQNFMAKQTARFLSKEWNTTVTVGSIYYKPFSSFSLNHLYVEDLDQDTLLYVEAMTARLDLRSLLRNRLVINDLVLKRGNFSLKRYADGTTNLHFIQAYFQPDTPRAEKRKRLDFYLPRATLEDIDLKYKNLAKTRKVVNGINYNDVHIYRLSGVLDDIDFKKHLFKSTIQDLSFYEKSGLRVKKLNAKAQVDRDRMEFSDLLLEMNNSRIGDHVVMQYDSFRDFSDFVNQVSIEGNFKNSRITSDDIAFFAPEVAVTKFDVWLNGRLTGKVNNISGTDVTMRLGESTWLKGDMRVSGLPKIEQTLFDMDLSQLITNPKELETLIAQLSGKDVFQLPTVFDRFGQVEYKGHVVGFYKDFIAHGIFKTKLGEIVSDINLKLHGKGTYSGELLVQDFDLGSLLQNTNLGHTRFRMDVSGAGFSVADLEEAVQGKIDYLDFKGYRYRDITLNGTFQRALLSAQIGIDDQNVQLEVKGNWNTEHAAQRIALEGRVDHANLRALGFYQKDTLSVSGSLSTNFVGTDLRTLQGSFQAEDLVLQIPDQRVSIDSLSITAGGAGLERQIHVQSDILEASLVGQYDLTTFPDYFKSLAKRYIPSWKTAIKPFGVQEFSVAVDVKDFEPIALVFMPEVEIPESFYLNGHFSSVANTATINGFISKIRYKGMQVNNLIIDQTAYDESLNLFMTSDRMDISDKLFVENINISNVLRNDSLNFNIKLSNQADPNQLDLNGLIEFDEHAAARLSLLPSDVIINYEDWRLQEKVKFDFEEEKTLLNGFELSNGQQVIKLDGAISNREDDVLNLSFENFSLATFNPLASSFGVALKGEMNGQMEIRSILRNPYVQSDMTATGMYFNESLIGDMELQAALDQNTKLVNLHTTIVKNEREAMRIDGTYNASRTENNLDLDLKMNDNELVIFQPFLRNLISDLSGTATAAFHIGGSIFEPIIDGTATLQDASFVVNYLKTPYTINDQLTVRNSVIHLDQTQITDVHNQQAVASGTVDMKNPATPTIHADVKTENFMVLNTTAKDNPLYYGTAYGTGNFSFNGPTNNMDINIDATTNAGTIFNIPLNSVGTITDQDFITFVTLDTTVQVTKRNVFQGLTMTLDLNVTNATQVNIYTDLGRLSGKGAGLLSLNITSMGDFEMFGDYVIGTGEFEFTAQDYINKIFEINRGGTIRWTGNPTEALINMTAVYEVRTSIAPLYSAAGRGSNDARVQAQAEMILNGNLLHPDISFGINFPSDSYIKDELQSYFSDANNVNQQALSLIVRRSFAPGTGTNLTRELNTTVLSAGTELAFNQLNNIISQSLNLNFVDFNIRSFNEASASIRLINDRLILTGGVTDRRAQLNDFNVFGKEVASDVEAIYLIRKNGNLLLRASNRLSNRNFLNPADEYVSALGLVYRQEFDTFGEFFRRMLSFNNRKETEPDTTSVKLSADSVLKGSPRDSIYFK